MLNLYCTLTPLRVCQVYQDSYLWIACLRRAGKEMLFCNIDYKKYGKIQRGDLPWT